MSHICSVHFFVPPIADWDYHVRVAGQSRCRYLVMNCLYVNSLPSSPRRRRRQSEYIRLLWVKKLLIWIEMEIISCCSSLDAWRFKARSSFGKSNGITFFLPFPLLSFPFLSFPLLSSIIRFRFCYGSCYINISKNSLYSWCDGCSQGKQPPRLDVSPSKGLQCEVYLLTSSSGSNQC